VAQMVRDGLLDEEEAFGHPDGNVVQRAIGQRGPVEPEIREPVALHDGDIVLVCSDGLHGAVPDRGIANVIGRSADAESICRNLLAAALEAGSADNVTIGCARISTSGPHRRLTEVGA
jgi:serine/threonine protein phosphatase PrpC